MTDKRTETIPARLKAALDLMTWGGPDGKPLPWDEAARTAQISARSMRRSLERPAVRRYLLEQKEVLRACLSARNLFHLDELVSQRENKGAAVQAAPPPEIPPDKSTWLGRSGLEWLRDTIYDSTMHSPWRPDDYGQSVSYSP